MNVLLNLFKFQILACHICSFNCLCV